MEEDEEIDILGDFDGLVSKTEREISNISAGQILSCDYTVHPRWLMDNLDSSDFAIDDNNIAQEICIGDDDTIYTSEDDFDKSGQSDLVEEDSEPDKGTTWNLEIANNSDIILEEAIPAAVEEEIVTNFYHTQPLANRSVLKINPNQIPIENPPPNPRSILKINLPPFKFRQTLKVDRDTFEKNKKILKKNLLSERNVETKAKKGAAIVCEKTKKPKRKPKFKQSVKIKIDKSEILFKSNLIKSKKAVKIINARKKRSGIIFDENITINHTSDPNPTEKFDEEDENFQNRIPKNDDSDIEIDIESGEPDLLEFQNETFKNESDPAENLTKLIVSTKLESTDQKPNKNKVTTHESPPDHNTLPNDPFLMNLLSNCSDHVKFQLENIDEPQHELYLNTNEITELERMVHSEFFEGRPTKTPDRYMKIRAHIINSWQSNRPNYVSKTAVRAGLKNCGDVNCISRIHSLLEQIGAINFGCHNEYFGYIRPLKLLISVFNQPARQNKSSSSAAVNNAIEFERRQRGIKTLPPASDSNFTISHSGGNERVTFGLEMKETKNKRNSDFDLIKCQQFNQNNFAPFKVSMTLSTLLCLYLHSLSSKHEVMGFLAGYRTKSVGRNKLSIARYKPCLTLKQSGTMCEMCPISQIEQSTSLLSEGYDLLGWFHTHPLFPPNPSRTDVRTQMEMQIQFSTNTDLPFVGVILGCVDMTCRCIYVLPHEISQWGDVIPYEINIDIIKDCTNFENDVSDVLNIIKNDPENYQTILDKFINAADNSLNKYGYDLSLLNFLNMCYK